MRLELACLLCMLVKVISTKSNLVDENTDISGNACSASKESECRGSAKVLIERSLSHVYSSSQGKADDSLQVVITFKNARENLNLQTKFKLTVSSLLLKSSKPIIFVIIGDSVSQDLAKDILATETRKLEITTLYWVADIDAELLAKELREVVEPMQRYFSSKAGSYYSDSLFFLSIAIHRVLPESLHKVIMIDADLKFKSDIAELFELFSRFSDSNIMGIARDNQPVYRHTFSLFRSQNPGTRVGDPPPHGLTGFNSGVLLLNLDQMRKSQLYNSLLNEETLKRLTTKYHFKGHLGDQDFFTLLSMEHEYLFYILPCGWNRQLCTWWKSGYPDVFDQYFKCDEPIHILHGNCNTPIPAE